MVDTIRSLVDLQTLLADNTTAQISAQDLRDFLVSSVQWDTTDWIDLTDGGGTSLHTHAGFSGSNSVFFAEDYGAVGDGTTDDTTSIQACIDAANAAGGGTVLFETSVYKITAALVPKSNVMISGNGYGSVIRQVTNATDGFKVTAAATIVATNFGITNLRIQSGHATAGKAINLGSVRSVLIDRIWIEGQTQNTHRWIDGIHLYDVSSANAASGSIAVGNFQIRDISSTAGSTGLYVNLNTSAVLFDLGYGPTQLRNGLITGSFYIDGTAITQSPARGALIEGGWNIQLDNVVAVGCNYGMTVNCTQTGGHTKNAGLGGNYVAYMRWNSCQFWTSGVTALYIRGNIAGLHTDNCAYVSLGSGYAVDIDTANAADLGFNSLYFSNSNSNGGIHIANTAGLVENLMGPIVFTETNLHGTTSGVQIIGGPHKVRFDGNEHWLNTLGFSTDASATALNVQLLNSRFYNCVTNLTWSNTGSRDNVIIKGNSPDSINDWAFDAIRLLSTTPTTISVTTTRLVDMNPSVTLSATTPALTGYIFRGTVTYSAASGGIAGFRFNPTYKNSGAVAPASGLLQGFSDLATIQADTNTITVPTYYSVVSNNTFNRINAGTVTVTDYTQFDAEATISAGATVTTRYGYRFQNASLAGTLTTQVGLEIAALSGATNNFGIRNADRSVQTKYARFGAITAPTNVTDGDVSCLRLLVGTDAAFPSGGVLFWVNQASLGSEVMRLTSTATNDDPAEMVYQNRVTTTDSTITTLHTFTVPTSTTYMIEARVVARRTGGSAGTAEDGGGYDIRGTWKNTAGTVALIGAVTIIYSAESQAAWSVNLTAVGATVTLTVAGATNNNITWHATSRVWMVGS